MVKYQDADWGIAIIIRDLEQIVNGYFKVVYSLTFLSNGNDTDNSVPVSDVNIYTQ